MMPDVRCMMLLLAVLAVTSHATSPEGKSGSSSSSSSSSSSESSECRDECGEPTLSVEEVTTDGCTGNLTFGDCFGDCATGGRYIPDDEFMDDSTCCRPTCFVQEEMDCSGTEDTFSYFVPTLCECKPCDDDTDTGPNVLVATCDDSIKVLYDGVEQTAFDGAENEDNWQQVSYYLLDRCNMPSNISIVCTDVANSHGGILASDSDGLITDSSWQCAREGATPAAATEVGVNGVGPWGNLFSMIDAGAYWIYDGPSTDVGGPGPIVTCTKTF